MADRTPPHPDCQDNAGCAPYFCPTSGEVECPQHGGFDVCCDTPEWHRRILAPIPSPAPVPPAALDAAIEAVKATQWVTFKAAADNWTSTAAGTPEEIAGAVLTAVAPILLAAGRTAAAADIRAEAAQLEEALRGGAGYSYAYGFADAADFIDPTTEGKTDG